MRGGFRGGRGGFGGRGDFGGYQGGGGRGAYNGGGSNFGGSNSGYAAPAAEPAPPNAFTDFTTSNGERSTIIFVRNVS